MGGSQLKGLMQGNQSGDQNNLGAITDLRERKLPQEPQRHSRSEPSGQVKLANPLV
jgi:hypothetical protein